MPIILYTQSLCRQTFPPYNPLGRKMRYGTF
jgi:hypothetical protein